MFRAGFQGGPMADQVKRFVFDGGLPPVLRFTFLEFDHFKGLVSHPP